MECGWASPAILHEMYNDNFDIHGLHWWAEWIEKENKKIKST